MAREMNGRLRKELEEILRRKDTDLTLEELAEDFERAGRFAPCAYFSTIPPASCKLGHELDCLHCSDYEPHEPPGSLESAICEFEDGKVYHRMKFAESDGFYRRGETFCGKFVDESEGNVEICDDETFSKSRLCKRCEIEYRKENEGRK